MNTIDELFLGLVKDLKITEGTDKMLLRVYLEMAADIGGIKALKEKGAL